MLIARKLAVTAQLGRRCWRPKDLADLDLLLSHTPVDRLALGEAIEAVFAGAAALRADAREALAHPSWWRSARSAARWRRFRGRSGLDADDLDATVASARRHLAPIPRALSDVRTLAFTRGGERWEVTWTALEVESWHHREGAVRTHRQRFVDPTRRFAFVRAQIAARTRAGFAPTRSPPAALSPHPPAALSPHPPTTRSPHPPTPTRPLRPEPPAAIGARLREAGHPHGAFLDLLARPDDPTQRRALEVRIHDAVFDDWDPDRVGVAWREGFVAHLHLHPTQRDPPAAIATLLAHPAAWRLETLTVATGRITVRRPGAPRPIPLRGQPLPDVIAALCDASLPPTLRCLGLRGDRAAIDLRGIATAATALRDLSLEVAAPVHELVAAAQPLGGTLHRLHIRGEPGDPNAIAALLARGRVPRAPLPVDRAPPGLLPGAPPRDRSPPHRSEPLARCDAARRPGSLSTTSNGSTLPSRSETRATIRTTATTTTTIWTRTTI